MENSRSKLLPVLAILMAACLIGASFAHAQERREHERERYHTDHWVYDDRFHHDHYYPQIGYSVAALPPGHVALTFRGAPFFFQAGVWYRRAGPRYIVARPPIGIVVPVLPPSYTTVWVAGAPYYYANDVYYAAAPGGYAVAAPPVAAAEASVPASPMTPPPQAGVAPAPQSQAGATWYYCESSKTYYPYVSQCREGWRPVPATPPQAR